jgi:nucleoside-diphosphate-sugar epimerase
MRLLILGGTVFLGRAVARYAVGSGHEVTCAARGESGAVPDGARLVRVDRSAPDGLSALTGEYDAVVDVARTPSHVRAAVEALGGRTGHWTFVSSGSAYADPATPAQRADSAPLLEPEPGLDDPTRDAEAYGKCKVACEQAVLAAGVPAFVCRAGLIVGPEDPTDRFTYWPVRLARGGPVLAPGSPDDLVQWIDVEDLAAWLVGSAESGRTGVYDGIGVPVKRGEFLAAVADGVGVTPDLVWVDQAFLLDHEVSPWMGQRSLPLWLPLPEYAGFLSRDVSRSLAAGLTCRPVGETAVRTLTWHNATPRNLNSGLDAADEARVLDLWQTSQATPG